MRKKNRDFKGALSAGLLIIGIMFGLVVFFLDGINQMGFAYNCVGNALFANGTVSEYAECVKKGTEIWFRLVAFHLVSVTALIASAIIALNRK